ncbi:alpha/beta fold hydrolase [Kitasatospora sp. NPDC087861]|uniref:alpha/beta fold hydrolase n=1 Tax=Kitasatospora sp. NPDC087861 TaxID=3364070 RepID=UPI00381F896E
MNGGTDVAGARDDAVRTEVTQWFFDDYLPTWVGVGSGAIPRGPEFILDYWAVPLHHSSPASREWLLDSEAVIGLLESNQAPLKAQGYSYTAVPDRRVTVYHDAGAAIEAIWSRRRSDGSEIERLAVHFEIARESAGWRIVGIQYAPTTADSLDAAGSWLSRMRHCESACVPGAGHRSHVEQPAAVARILTDFVDRIATTQRGEGSWASRRYSCPPLTTYSCTPGSSARPRATVPFRRSPWRTASPV